MFHNQCKLFCGKTYNIFFKVINQMDMSIMFSNIYLEIINEAFDPTSFTKNKKSEIQFFIQQPNNNFQSNQFPQKYQHHYPNYYQRINNNNNFNYQNKTGNDSNNFIQEEKPHLRGLVNIASTCYMNSILQCFAHISELSDYFKTEKMNRLAVNNLNNKNMLYPVFQEVIINLWNTWDKTPYSPYNFKKRIGEMNPLFQGAYPNDAKDLMTFILLRLHDELNNPKNNNINMNNNILFNIKDQQNKQLMFKRFSQNFICNYRSIISGLFFGLFYSKIKCTFCQKIFYNYQTFNFIVFPLEKVLQYKMSLTNFTSNFNNTVTIEDCFKHYQLTSIMNDYYCNLCKHNVNCAYENKFSILPIILIIILNRGKGLQYNVNISFENENLGLKNYVEYCKDESVYELIGLVTHYGNSSASGHFMARCKSPIDGNWYLYNDQTVTKIGYFDKNSFSQGNPYILFYKKIRCQ